MFDAARLLIRRLENQLPTRFKHFVGGTQMIHVRQDWILEYI